MPLCLYEGACRLPFEGLICELMFKIYFEVFGRVNVGVEVGVEVGAEVGVEVGVEVLLPLRSVPNPWISCGSAPQTKA